MYRRFLNDADYLSVITAEALSQITRGEVERMIQAEESVEMSIIEYLSENYEVEKELGKGKYIADYDRRISFPVGAHFYLEGDIYEVIRFISGYKAPASVVYWEESSDPNIIVEKAPVYSQFKTYHPGDLAVYNGLCYLCLSENGYDFGNIRLPMVSGWLELVPKPWQPVVYGQWDVVQFEGAFYAVTAIEGFDENLNPAQSPNWGEIANYDPGYNAYELAGHEYVVYDGRVWYPETDVNADIPEPGLNIIMRDPRNYNLKKHMVRLAVYELTKLIAPNNVSTARLKDQEDSMKWLYDASKLRINPQIPRKVADDQKEVMDWQLATFQTDYDPWKNPWLT
ncbi:hypothetical protein [Alistipes indistinctus]|uniref:hypothetical protein n=1 Tax=Alistipes indistinctus TaxID=626932 RepID=UPI003AB26E94